MAGIRSTRSIGDAGVAQQAWNVRRGEILQTFVATYPGQRPFAWWRFDAPELRQRVGGIGTPLPIKLIEWGVQRLWYWPSFAKAANERNECANDSVVAADLNDPPVFEGQGAYLRRLGLLLANETPLPKTLTPEAVEINHE